MIRLKNNIPVKYRFLNVLRFYFGDKFVSKVENRIKVISGDISENSTFGMYQDELLNVAKNVNVIINSGAIVKHFGQQREFESINVNGAKNVIKFCRKYGKRLIHISTVSVSGNDKKSEIENSNVFSENDLYIGQDFTNIYISTKFEAEVAVLEAIYEGLDAQILRLGNISNRYSDGAFQHNINDNAFAKRLKSFIEIGAFPRYFLGHQLEFTPVDLAAGAILKILNYSSDCNMFHIVNTQLLSVSEFVKTANGMGIDLIPVSDILMNDIINGVLSNDDRKYSASGIVQDLNRDKKLIYTSSTKLNFDFTENYLKNLRIQVEKA